MAKEWFTIPELRAAGLAYFTPVNLQMLRINFQHMAAHLGRRREPAFSGALYPLDYQEEYHVSNFPPGAGRQLQAIFAPDGIVGRIIKLGIHRPVASPQGQYEGNASLEELDELRGRIVERLIRVGEQS